MAYKTGGTTRISDSRDATLTNVALPTTGGVRVNSVGGGGGTPISSPMLGTVKGMIAGGALTPSADLFSVASMAPSVEAFPFAAENAVSIYASLKGSIGYNTGHSSTSDGYSVAGMSVVSPALGFNDPSQPVYMDYNYLRSIDKIPFSTTNSCIFVGNLAAERAQAGGHSSPTGGYISGGLHFPSGIVTNPTVSPSSPGLEFGVSLTAIETFPFSSGGIISSYIGDLGVESYQTATHSSATDGFSCQNTLVFSRVFPQIPTPRPGENRIDKFPFSTNVLSVTVGDIIGDYFQAGISSPSTGFGYIAGYYLNDGGGVSYNSIQKYPFTSENIVGIIGGLTISTYTNTGLSSSSHGYSVSGVIPTSPYYATNIERFPFSSDTPSTYVGDISQGRFNLSAGIQD
jgi:hypothetical protein